MHFRSTYSYTSTDTFGDSAHFYVACNYGVLSPSILGQYRTWQ